MTTQASIVNLIYVRDRLREMAKNAEEDYDELDRLADSLDFMIDAINKERERET